MVKHKNQYIGQLRSAVVVRWSVKLFNQKNEKLCIFEITAVFQNKLKAVIFYIVVDILKIATAAIFLKL